MSMRSMRSQGDKQDNTNCQILTDKTMLQTTFIEGSFQGVGSVSVKPKMLASW